MQIVEYVLTWRSYSFICTLHHLIIIFVQAYLEDIEIIKCLSDIFVECVSKIRYMLSIIHYKIRGAVCFQFNHFPCDDRENIHACLIIIIKSEVWTITHCLGVRSWNNGVRCMSFCTLIIEVLEDNVDGWPRMIFGDRKTWDQTLWRHQIETFSALLALCAGNSSVTGEFPSQRPVTWSFDVFFDLRLNKRLSKQSKYQYLRRHRAHNDANVMILLDFN